MHDNKREDGNAVRDVISDSRVRRYLARALSAIRARLGGDRVNGVSDAISAAIVSFRKETGNSPKLLDFGCGNMAIGQILIANNVVSTYFGVDTYEPPAELPEKFKSYAKITDPTHLPFPDHSFDVAICVDVLHHIGIGKTAGVLKELVRVAGLVVVKDHFEYGLISRHLLRLADWYGNYAYGVNVPDRYFDRDSWAAIVNEAQLIERVLVTPVKVHNGLFGYILPAKHHYVSVLSLP